MAGKLMDANDFEERAREAFRLAAPPVDTDSFCRATLAREAGRAQKTSHLLRSGDRRLRLAWKIAVATVGAAVIAGAVVAAVVSSRATADESPLATLDWHGFVPLELGYLPDHSNWSQTYWTVLEPAMSDADVAAIKQGAKPGVRVEQCLYQNGPRFVEVRTVTDTGEPMPNGSRAEVKGRPAVVQTGLSGVLAVTDPDLAAEFLGAQPQQRMTTTTAGPDVSGGVGAYSSEVAGAPPASTAPIAYRDAVRLTWIVDGTRVQMLSNLSVEELVKVGESLVLGRMT
jgi:hypothetical protein